MTGSESSTKEGPPREKPLSLHKKISDKTKNSEDHDALLQYTRRLETLREIDHAILIAQSAKEIAMAIASHLPRLIPCMQVGVGLFEENGAISLLAIHEGQTQQVTAPTPEEDTDMLEQLAAGKDYVIEDVRAQTTTSAFTTSLKEADVHTRICHPLLNQEQVLGFLDIGMPEVTSLTDEQARIVDEIAHHLVLAIQRTRHEEDVRRHAEALERRVQQRTAELRASQARFQVIFEDAAIGIALLDEQGGVVTSNPALQTTLGYSAEELEGLSLAALTRASNDVDATNLYSELMAGKREHYRVEGRYRHKNGRPICANLTISLARLHEQNARFAIVMVEDVTEQKEMQDALIQSEKLALTGRIAATLAHEVNNPLQSVIGFMSLAKEMLEDGDDPQAVGDYLQIAIEEVKRAAGIVAQMRDFNRKSRPDEQKPGNANEIVECVLTLSKKKFEDQHVELEWTPAAALPVIPLSSNRIQQVTLNLVLNALDAMPDGGKLSVSTTRTTQPKGVRIRFTDNGVGIPENRLSHLFKPFYTTKPTGMGLGLYVSRTIVEEHGGHITVESKAGDGATFNVWLPA